MVYNLVSLPGLSFNMTNFNYKVTYVGSNIKLETSSSWRPEDTKLVLVHFPILKPVKLI